MDRGQHRDVSADTAYMHLAPGRELARRTVEANAENELQTLDPALATPDPLRVAGDGASRLDRLVMGTRQGGGTAFNAKAFARSMYGDLETLARTTRRFGLSFGAWVTSLGVFTLRGPDPCPPARASRLSATLGLGVGRIGAPQVTGWNFDWDDNIFFMPTKIRIFHKTTGKEVGVSTSEFALIREKVGKEGPYADYEMRQPDSLAWFGDDPTGKNNFFADDVRRTIADKTGRWKGPSWDAFVTALSDEETAKHTTIITARLHSPETIYAGLVMLRDLGYIKYLPPVENIYPVSNPRLAKGLGATAQNPSAAKAVVMTRILDGIQAAPFGRDAKKVLAPSGDGERVMHLWGFSDDDFGNYQKAVAALSEEVKKGRWPDVKITVFFTGTNHPTERPRAEIIMPNGKTRLARSEELEEAEYLIGLRARCGL